MAGRLWITSRFGFLVWAGEDGEFISRDGGFDRGGRGLM
jgi:hypothetical protein